MRHPALVALLILTCLAAPLRAADGIDEAVMARLGWKVAMQCWTANKMTVFEAIDYAKGVGFHHVEMFPGQTIAKDIPVKNGPGMDAETLAKLKAKLAEAGVKAVAFGVTGVPGDEAGMRKLYAWAKELGIEVINSEPDPKNTALFATAAKLGAEYGIKLGLHNHPKPSKYWNPEFTLGVVKDHGPWVGLCTDTGHYHRSGLVAVDCLKQVEGRIVSMHLKDLGENRKDVPHGTGVNRAADQLAEIKRQGFKGVISVEYEVWDAQQRDNLVACVAFFNREAAKLAP